MSTLGFCEDSGCVITSSHEPVRLFRCAIHCDRNLCLHHLNTHNTFYEEEKKQNDIVLGELQKSLIQYQTVFDQQLVAYRELVRQVSTALLQNSSSLSPIDEIQLLLRKVQRAISVFRGEKIVIKAESIIDTTDIETDTNQDVKANSIREPGETVVVRIPRLDCEHHAVRSRQTSPKANDENINTFHDKENVNPAQLRKDRKKRRKTRGRKNFTIKKRCR